VINELGSNLFSVANISNTGSITYITSNATQTLDTNTTLYQSSASSISLLIFASQTLTCKASQIATTGQEITVAQWSGSGVDTVTRQSTNANMIVNIGTNTNADLSNITLNTVTYTLSELSMTGTHKFLNSSKKIELFLNNCEYTVGSDVAMINQLRNDIGTNSGLAKLNVYDYDGNTGLYYLFDNLDTDQDRTKPLRLQLALTQANISTAPGSAGFGYTTTAEYNADNSRTGGALVRIGGVYTDIAGIGTIQNLGSGIGSQYQIITIRDNSMEALVNSDVTKAGTFFQLFAYNYSLIEYEQ
jgi:hypothetical protein